MTTQTELRHIRVDLVDEPETSSRLTIQEESVIELAQSIAAHGLLEPIGVQPYGPGERLRLCYGQRRLRAVRRLGWFTIPAIILPDDVDEADARQHENNQRVQLTPVEEAYELRRWVQRGESLPSIAARMNRSLTWVQHRVRLLDYPDQLLDAIHTHGIPLTVADLLAKFEHAGYRAHMIDEVIRHGASAATVAVWLSHYQVDRARLDANTNTVEEIAARRHDFRVMSPCDYCADETELQHTRIWRLCRTCTDGLLQATRQRHPPGGPDARH